jgi:predicted DNA-binding transcriptional regulator YafY
LPRSTRMFEIIQLLRRAKQPLTAGAMAAQLEVTKRTVYRDIAALQAMRVPIEGEAGIGYLMRPGFDLPPLMFTAEEVEAISVGLALLGRTGDRGLVKAAQQAGQKIASILPQASRSGFEGSHLRTSTWHAMPECRIDPAILREAIRAEAKLAIHYEDGTGRCTERIIQPLAIIYYIEVAIIAAWCEWRSDFRHFRIDRIAACTPTGAHFTGTGEALRQRWGAAIKPMSEP